MIQDIIKRHLHHFCGYSRITLFVRKWGRQSIFWGGILFYLFAHIGMIHLPTIFKRSVPVEPDDTYAYILKAEQMRSCFWMDCPAVKDLRQQLSIPPTNEQSAWDRNRHYHRTVRIYHPFHSVILLAFHTMGLSWENAYNVTAMCGAVFIACALGYWLYGIFGYGPSGIALFLSAFTYFSGQGLHFVVPSNLSLGVAILTWGIIIQARKQYQWLLPLCILAMITMHSIGQVYAVVTLLVYILFNYSSFSKHTWIISGTCVVILVLFWGFPLLLSQDLFSRYPIAQKTKGLNDYRENVDIAINLARKLVNTYRGNFLIFGTALLIGFFSTFAGQRRKVLFMGGVLGFLLLGSLFYVYPGRDFSDCTSCSGSVGPIELCI
jgi:hypothetical protein